MYNQPLKAPIAWGIRARVSRNRGSKCEFSIVKGTALEKIFDAAGEILFIFMKTEYWGILLDDIESDRHNENQLQEDWDWKVDRDSRGWFDKNPLGMSESKQGAVHMSQIRLNCTNIWKEMAGQPQTVPQPDLGIGRIRNGIVC